MYLSGFIFKIKTRAKTRQANILKVVAAINICAPRSAFISCPAITAIITIKVRPDRKRNNSQKRGTNKLP